MLKLFLARHWVAWLLIAVVTGLGTPALMGGVSMLGKLPEVGVRWPLALIGLAIIAANLKVLKFRLILFSQSVWFNQIRGLRMYFATAFAANATPGSVAAPFTAMAVLQRYNVPAATTMASLLLVSVLDALATLGLLAGTLFWWSVDLENLPASFQLIAVVMVFLLLLISGYLVYRRFRPLLTVMLAVMKRLGLARQTRLRITRQLLRFRWALTRATRLGVPAVLVLLGLAFLHQALWYSMLFLAVRAFGGHISWPLALVIQLASAGGARLLLLPGGAGGAEVAALSMLSMTISTGLAGAAILLWRLCGYYFFLLTGLVAFLTELGLPSFRAFTTGRAGTD